jgi:predicted DNA binding CopG/RHH family protein
MAKNTKKIPHLRSESEERKFWEKQDSTDYVDWNRAQRVRFTELKPSTTAISIRLPTDLLEQIKTSANRKDVPYQSLIKLWLAEKMANQQHEHLHRKRSL